jgi:hypothetical protein
VKHSLERENIFLALNMSENKEKKRKCGKFRSLTKTNCPVLLNPVPFFIKIKKKFIRTLGAAVEL